MNNIWKIIGLGILSVLVFDTISSFASLYFGFPYSYASVGSAAIYGAIGYYGYRVRGFFIAIGAALLVEAFDATIGWYISWKIGPGAIPTEQATPAVIAIAIFFVLIFAAVSALVGAVIARFVHGARKNS